MTNTPSYYFTHHYLTLKGRGGLEGLRSVASRVPDPGEPRGPAARG